MAIFTYKAIDESGNEITGDIDAVNRDVAINALQRRGLIISSINDAAGAPIWQRDLAVFERVSIREVVILSRQIATLFEAQVSALKVFGLLAGESENPLLRKALTEVVDDLRGGSPISKALAKHPKIFSDFYVNMVKVGEESGKLQEVFLHMADYLDRTYEVTSKARNALIYPAFVIFTFIAVMVLMLTTVIPRISTIITDTTTEIPIYTKVVLALSGFFVQFWPFMLIALAVAAFIVFRLTRSEQGRKELDRFKINVPYVGNLYRKLYLSRIADNLNIMLIAGIPVVRALETTSNVVGNKVYASIMDETVEAVRGGATVSAVFAQFEEIPGIMTQMVRIGEETGELGSILSTLAMFYRREVSNAVDTLVDLIEPAMIVLLGLGVGTLLASVLVPIYNIATSI